MTTYHGPGQLVGYPLLDLKAHNSVCPHLYRELMGECEKVGERFGGVDYSGL